MARRFGRNQRRRLREEVARANEALEAHKMALQRTRGEVATLRRLLYAALPEAPADETTPDLTDLPIQSRFTMIRERSDEAIDIEMQIVVGAEAYARIKGLLWGSTYGSHPRVRIEGKSLIVTSCERHGSHGFDQAYALNLTAENRPMMTRRV